VIYENPQNSNVALCIINTGSILKKVRSETKVLLRLDGIFNKEYNKKFNRPINSDMSALHEELKRDIPHVHTIFQSEWSKNRVFEEIVTTDNYSIIHNGCDTNYFRPAIRKSDGYTNLLAVGKMRNGYFMDALIGTYRELKKKKQKIRLLLAGSMDKECQDVYNKYRDEGILSLGSTPNNELQQIYSQADIFLAPRQGSSSDNVISEAQSCGLPVICAAWSGNAEMVTEQTGRIVDGGHWDYGDLYNQKLAAAIEEVLGDLQGFKTRARKHAEKQLSLEVMVDKYLGAMIC
jgi:glycosyltransferase involved in cell wall biosynthesis